MTEITSTVQVDGLFKGAATSAHFDINAVTMDIKRLQKRIRTSSELLRNTALEPGCPPHYALKFNEIANQLDEVTIDGQVKEMTTAVKSLEMLVKSR